jgi:ATP/maltotriose-dependent transcriptional regulator MalT
VTVISAPAGSGKTSLLRAWADRPGRAQHIAVAAVRRDEQDAQLFSLTLLNAVRRALRLAGELAEIRAADLRFSERETRELLDASGIALSEAGSARLHQRTDA